MITALRNSIRNALSSDHIRAKWLESELSKLPHGALLLDAGCGSQQYRSYCSHLDYRSQDFGQYEADISEGFASGLGGALGYQYGKLDYVGDIWKINEKDETFDAILCTEVFEHIPFPTETIAEFSRLIKRGGTLILTLPSNCLRHMDPYYFYSGFSNRYIEKFLVEAGFDILKIDQVGDYYSWIAAEIARTIKNHGFFARILLLPSLFWYMRRPETEISRNTLCMGYHVVAKKKVAP
jgi:SAM-dependent methyltransferase